MSKVGRWAAGLVVCGVLFVACGGGGGSSTNATDSGGETSTTTLGAVTGLTVTAGDGQNVVTWDAVSGAVSYNLYWDQTDSAALEGCSGANAVSGITETSYTHTGLTNGTSYSYAVTAVNGNGNSGACGGSSGSGLPAATATPTTTPTSTPTTSPTTTPTASPTPAPTPTCPPGLAPDGSGNCI